MAPQEAVVVLMRILHAPTNIANQSWYAAQGLRALGHEVEVWDHNASPFGFPSDRVIEVRREDPRALWDTFLEATERFDVFHFHYARSLLPYGIGGVPPYWDLPVLRLLGKKIFFTFHGHDCAIRRIHLEKNRWSYFRFSDLTQNDDDVEKRIQTIRSYADAMFIVALDYLDFIPDAKWVPRIIDLGAWPEQPPSIRDVPVILHMPSNRGKKGTEFILDGLRRLQEEGVKFDMRLVEGASHDDARKAIQDADIVIDNVITGDYEIVSMETMASSRVAVANLSDRVRRELTGVPVWDVDPDSFVPRMRDLIADRTRQLELAGAGRTWVATKHDALVVAKQLEGYYKEPARAPGLRPFPDWLDFGDQRKVEQLEQRVATLTVEQMRAREQIKELQSGSGRNARGGTWKDAVPDSIRVPLRKLRKRLGR